LAIEEMLPAPAQGAVGIECRADDAMTAALLAAIDHHTTSRAVRSERAFLAALDATCHSPIAALATIADDIVTLRAELLSEDGGEHVAGDASGPDGEALARDLASALFERATPAIRAGFAG
jgi:hydroxymethylbilane synthase